MDEGILAALLFIAVIGLFLFFAYIDDKAGEVMAYAYAFFFWGCVALAIIGIGYVVLFG